MEAETKQHFSLKNARTFLKLGNFGSSVANYLFILKKRPDLVVILKDEFLDSLISFCGTLEQTDKVDEAVEFMNLALTIYPDSPEFLIAKGQLLYRQRKLDEAGSCFLRALNFDPQNLVARQNFENLRTHLVDQWHFSMLNDSIRNSTYARAIEQQISLNFRSVLDVGCGTSLLSMLAARAGATDILACDSSKVWCEVAGRILRDNEYSSIVVVRNAPSFDLSLDKPRTLLVTELMDVGFFGEGILNVFHDVYSRNLLDMSRFAVIPRKAEIFIRLCYSPVFSSEHFYRQGSQMIVSNFVGSWSTEPYASYDVTQLDKFDWLSEATLIDTVFLASPECVQEHFNGFQKQISALVHKSGFVNAIVLWFNVELAPGICLSNSPNSGTAWEQAVYPVLEFAVKVNTHYDLTVELTGGNRLKCFLPHSMQNFQLFPAQNPSLIPILNQDSLTSFYWCALHAFKNSHFCACLLNVLDLTGFLSANLDFKSKCFTEGINYTSLCSESSILPLREESEGFCSEVSLSKLAKCTSFLGFQCAVFFPLEWSGLLKPNSLEDLALYRLEFGLDHVFPTRISIMGKLISSQTLRRCTELIEEPMGFKMQHVVNDYRSLIQQDIDISRLADCSDLSDCFTLIELDFCEPLDASTTTTVLPSFLKQQHTVSVPCIKPGTVHAILVWYDLFGAGTQEGDCCKFSTLSTGFHQAAYMVSEPLEIYPDIVVRVDCNLERSCLFVTLVDANATQ